MTAFAFFLKSSYLPVLKIRLHGNLLKVSRYFEVKQDITVPALNERQQYKLEISLILLSTNIMFILHWGTLQQP